MNDRNARLRYEYGQHLKGPGGFDEKTIDAVRRHLAEFEAFIGSRDFSTVTANDATKFQTQLRTRLSRSGSGKLSASSVVHTLSDVKAFYIWLADIKGDKRVDRAAIGYSNPPKRLWTEANSGSDRAVPTPEHIRQMLAALPSNTMIERRDRPLIAFIYLTGMRVGAVISTRCKHVRLGARQVNQDASEVDTKFGKNMLTTWFPVGADIEAIVVEWVNERLATGPGLEAPLFPPTARFRLHGVVGTEETAFWKNTTPVTKIFRRACEMAKIEYFNPHSFRKTLGRLGRDTCLTFEELKAWSQNLGHEKLDTTMISYARIDSDRQDELIQGLVRTDTNVREEQELLIILRLAGPESRDAIRTLAKKSLGRRY